MLLRYLQIDPASKIHRKSPYIHTIPRKKGKISFFPYCFCFFGVPILLVVLSLEDLRHTYFLGCFAQTLAFVCGYSLFSVLYSCLYTYTPHPVLLVIDGLYLGKSLTGYIMPTVHLLLILGPCCDVFRFPSNMSISRKLIFSEHHSTI